MNTNRSVILNRITCPLLHLIRTIPLPAMNKIIQTRPIPTRGSALPRAQLCVDGSVIPLKAVTVFSSHKTETDMVRVGAQLAAYRDFQQRVASGF